MKRLEYIQKLEQVQENIETVEKQINKKIEDTAYYRFFGNGSKDFYHDKEIRKKCLAYWKRRFNRILLEIGYNL
jgi:hypothetical protein